MEKNLFTYLHKLNKKVYKNAYKRYGKKIECIPVIEGNGRSKRHHFHLALNKPPFIDDLKFIFITTSLWPYGHVDCDKDTDGRWKEYILKFKSKDYLGKEYLDSIMIEHMHFLKTK